MELWQEYLNRKHRELLMSQGTTPLPASPQETARWLAAEQERWAKVVRESGFKLKQ